jgi:hypothetical protein
MVSLFYDCNECKEKLYVKENRLRESNQSSQQQIVDQQIDAELGLETTATNLGRLAKRVINSLGSELIPADRKVVETAQQKTPIDYLKQVIASGKLTELFDRIKAIPPKKLTPKARIVQSDLKSNKEVKDTLNEDIANIVGKNISAEEKSEEIKKAVIDIAAGGDATVMEELAGYTSDASNTSVGSVGSDGSDATTAASTWQSVLNEFSELKPAEATINKFISDGKERNKITLLSKTNPDKPLKFGPAKTIKANANRDGISFYARNNKPSKVAGKKLYKTQELTSQEVKPYLSDLNVNELIRSLTV